MGKKDRDKTVAEQVSKPEEKTPPLEPIYTPPASKAEADAIEARGGSPSSLTWPPRPNDFVQDPEPPPPPVVVPAPVKEPAKRVNGHRVCQCGATLDQHSPVPPHPSLTKGSPCRRFAFLQK